MSVAAAQHVGECRQGGGVHSFYFSNAPLAEELSLLPRLANSGAGVDASWHVIPLQSNHSPRRRRLLPLNFPCCCPSDGQHLGAFAWTLPHRRCSLRLSTLALDAGQGLVPGLSPAHMEGDVMDKVEATATVCDFDPISGSIPATKVEITVSCR